MSPMIDRIPQMTDDELANLSNNVQRLAMEGTDKQKLAAAAMLPALGAELALRKVGKKQAQAERRAEKAKQPAKPAKAGDLAA